MSKTHEADTSEADPRYAPHRHDDPPAPALTPAQKANIKRNKALANFLRPFVYIAPTAPEVNPLCPWDGYDDATPCFITIGGLQLGPTSLGVMIAVAEALPDLGPPLP